MLCSYARSALFTSGMFDTRESDFHSSLPSADASPAAAAEDGEAKVPKRLRWGPSSSSARRSSSISDGDGSDGEDVPEVMDKAGVGWNAA